MRSPLFLFFFTLLSQQLISQDLSLDWSKSYGSDTYDQLKSMALDSEGNIYLTGGFRNTVDFDPGPGVYEVSSYDEYDLYVLKLDPTGSFLWVKTFASNGSEIGKSIEIDAANNILVAGDFEITIAFDVDAESWHTSVGNTDVFVLKLDNDGNYIWSKSFGGWITDEPRNILTDSSGAVYTCGTFRGLVDFDTGDETYFIDPGFDSPAASFIHKLDVDGNFVWVKTIDISSICSEMEFDSQNNLYVVGRFADTADFDPSEEIFDLASVGGYDGFIQKFNTFGDFLWAKSFGSVGDEICARIAIDGNDNLYVGGGFQDTVDFDLGDGIHNVVALGFTDIYVLKLDSLGEFIWAKTLEGPGHELLGDLNVQNDSTINICGTYVDFDGFRVDFDPEADEFYIVNHGWDEAFIMSINDEGNFLWAKAIGGDDQDFSREVLTDSLGNIFFIGGFRGTADLDPSPDSELWHCADYAGDNYVLKLKPCPVEYTTQTVSSCESYLWADGITYYESTETATYTFLNVTGCDSVVTLNLTILNSSESYNVATACHNYTSPTGNVYTESGIYTDTLINSEGCDSIIVTNLTIIPNGGIFFTDGVLSSNIDLATYQWVDCENDYEEILGETNQTFVPTSNGIYAIITNKSGCVDTSDCISLIDVTLINNNHSKISVYPNPFDDFITIDFGKQPVEGQKILVHNTLGQEIYRNDNLSGSTLILTKKEFGTGVYFLSLATNNETVFLAKLIVQ